MAKKKKDDGGTKRKASSGGPTKNIIAGLAGGALGAIAGALTARAGVDPKTAAIGIVGAGAVGAFTASGAVRWAATGAAAAGAGQLALGWLAKKTLEAQQTAAQASQTTPAMGSGGPRQGLPGDVAQAFRDAREQMQDDYAN